MTEPNLVNIKKWHDALVSGDFEQGQGALIRNGRFCCLGVACHVAMLDNVAITEMDDDTDHGFFWMPTAGDIWREADTLPKPVQEWLGITDYDPYLTVPEEYADEENERETVRATTLNDDRGFDFYAIANCIHATWPAAFPLVGSDQA